MREGGTNYKHKIKNTAHDVTFGLFAGKRNEATRMAFQHNKPCVFQRLAHINSMRGFVLCFFSVNLRKSIREVDEKQEIKLLWLNNIKP